MEIFKLFGSIFVDTTEADEKIEKTGKKSESLGSKFMGVAKTAAKWGLAIGGAAITAAGAIGGAAVNTAVEVDKAMGSFIASTGEATEASGKYEEVLKNIYKNNYGEDFQDIADSMSQVKTQLKEIDEIELQNVTENALALRDTFGFEVNESVRSAKMMMDQFGISSEEAYNLMAQGAQSGLDKNGDLLDTINEYSVHFEQLGFDAAGMFNFLKAGADSGAFSIDKVGDAIKEFGIRAKDGSDSTKNAFAEIGLNADATSQKFAQGGKSASKAFFEVLEGLESIKDPMKQNQVGIALFGTMWEDLGAESVLQIMNWDDAFNGLTDTMGQIKEIKYDNLSDMFEGLKRNVEMLLLPLGNALMPILQQIIQVIMDNMPMIEGIFSQMTPVITNLFSQLLPPLMNLMQSIMPTISNLLQQLIPFISQVLEQLLPPLVNLLNMLLPPILQIIEQVLPILMQLLQPVLQLLQPVIDLLKPIIDLLMLVLDPLLQLINFIVPSLTQLITALINIVIKPLQTAFQNVANILGGAFSNSFGNISKYVNAAKTVFENIMNFIKNVFTGNWKRSLGKY